MARRRKRFYCKPFSAAALARGTKIERREHGLSLRASRKIARDHLCEKGERAYPQRGFGALKRRGFKMKGWHHARGMIDVGIPTPATCVCKCEKGIHYGKGHTGECLTIGCKCKAYAPSR